METELERFVKMGTIKNVVKTLYLAQEAILKGSHNLTPQMENALVEIKQTLNDILGKENEHD